jgi:hypothetical protein
MAKKIAFGTILTVIVLIVILNQLPSSDVTDSKSAIKNAQQGLVTDKIIDAEGEVINTLGDQAIDSACKNGASQGCFMIVRNVNTIGIAFTILIYGLIIAGIIGAVIFVARAIQSLI